MIYDRVENAGSYLGISPNLDIAIRAIQDGTYLNREAGKHELAGDDVYFNVLSVSYKQENLWEYHKNYLDIQISLDGGEVIRCANKDEVEGWEAYITEKDAAFAPYSEKGLAFPMEKGRFMILFPQDAHMPGLGKPGKEEHKAVFKIRL